MWALVKLQAKTTFKNPSMLMMVIMPLLMVSILGTAFQHTQETYTVVIGNVVTLNLVPVTLMGFGSVLFELRKSILMKRIGASSITKTEMMTALFGWSTLLALTSIIWTMTLATIFGVSGSIGTDPTTGAKIIFDWGAIHWGSFIYGIIFGVSVSLGLGFFFVSIAKNQEMFHMMSSIYMMLVMFLAGLIFPSQADWMKYGALILPHTYVNGALTTAFYGQNIFALNDAIYVQSSALVTYIDPIERGELVNQLTDRFGSDLIFEKGRVMKSPITFIDLLPGEGLNGEGIEFLNDTYLETDKLVLVGKVKYQTQLYSQAKAIANVIVPPLLLGTIAWTSTKTFHWDAQ